MSKNKKFTISLPGSEHRAVRVKLVNMGFNNDDDRVADVTFPSDAIDIKLYMMESDLRVLGKALLKNTRDVPPIKTFRSEVDLSAEIHHRLNKEEMEEIRTYREELAYKTIKQADKLFTDWVENDQMSARQIKLLCLYIYG